MTARVDLPGCNDAPRRARNTVGDLLDTWHVGDLDWVYDVLLITSELVTTAVQHGNDRVRLEVSLLPTHLTVAVSEQARMVPGVVADTSSPIGRGAAIVESVASRWGVDPISDGGNRVWAEVANPPL